MANAVNLYQVKQELGEDVAKSIQKQYPGMYIYSSNDPSALDFESAEAKYQYILKLYTKAGKSYLEIAEILGLSKSRVSKIVAEQIKRK